MVNVKLTALWAGIFESSLKNGEASEEFIGVRDEVIIQSIYIPEIQLGY